LNMLIDYTKGMQKDKKGVDRKFVFGKEAALAFFAAAVVTSALTYQSPCCCRCGCTHVLNHTHRAQRLDEDN